jgi:hypothetical protein
MKKISLLLLLLTASVSGFSQIKIAKLKYNGGGDWYTNKTALPNLIRFFNQNLKGNIHPEEDIIEVGDRKIFQYPYIYMTGHGNVVFSPRDVENLRTYLLAGGFLHIDDNYGLAEFARREMKKVFPEYNFVDLPYSHPIFQQKYKFATGLPKIHEHDGKPAQGFGIIHEGRLVCFFSYESDLGNGWEDRSVHNVPEEVRQEALKMGANLLQFAFTSY